MRPDLQAVCHLEYGRQNAENNQTNQNGDHNDDNRRNQLRDQANGLVEFALINVGDGLHGFGEMSCLFSHRHHVREQIREQFLRLQSCRERRAIDDCSADLAQLEFEESVPGNFSYQIE